MTTVCIIQARMRSTRLPGKVLLDLHGHTVLWHVVTRCKQIPGVDKVCVATPDSTESRAIAWEALKAKGMIFFGSEDDVLSRYYECAKALEAQTIVRVTSDCPLISPWLCGETLKLLKETGHDIAVNNEPRTWPHGLDCEAFTFSALERAHREATEPEDREHVTPWMRRNLELDRLIGTGDGTPRLTLDTLEDYINIWEAMRAG